MQHIEINNSTIHGSVVAGETISHCFNQLAAIPPANTELKDLLTALLNEIKSLNDKVPASQAQQLEDLSNDAKALLEESSRPEPRKKRLDVSLEGLKEAATALGGLADSILPLATKLSVLLLG